MTAQERLKHLMASELQAMFTARAFRKRGLTFYRRAGDNFALVQFQKSVHSTATDVEFTVNLGVFSAHLQRELAQVAWVPPVKDVPTESACHLRRRLGFLLPEARDTWWTLKPETSTSALGAMLRELLDRHAFPFLDELTTDEGLRDYWTARQESGPHGLALLILYRDIGPREVAAPLLERLLASAAPDATGYRASLERLAATLK